MERYVEAALQGLVPEGGSWNTFMEGPSPEASPGLETGFHTVPL